ncbi:MAG: Fe-S protein assembly co-chaperone HscB [Planctomycetota bacterium]
MTACTSCGAALESSLVCEACGALQSVDGPVDPWSAFGLVLGFAVDAAALKKRLLSLQRRMHPDFFGAAADDVRELADRNTAELNGAHKVLADAVRRANHLLERLGGPNEEAERQMPQAFLLEVLEWNETLEEADSAAPGSPERAALDELERTLTDQRAEAVEHVGAMLTPLPDAGAAILTDVRKELNAVRYFDRTLRTLSELRLEQAKSTT